VARQPPEAREAIAHAAVDPDEDYLGFEVNAFNEGFVGPGWIHAGMEEPIRRFRPNQ
jgi:hypothetical protein